MSHSEQYALVGQNADDDVGVPLRSRPTGLLEQKVSYRTMTIIAGVSLFLNFLAFVALTYGRYGRNSCPTAGEVTQVVYSPAQNVISYIPVKFHRGYGNEAEIYDRAPSDEVDTAWEDLYRTAGVKIPKQDAVRLPNKTYPVPGDESFYVTAFDVFHELHCLDTIRRAVHKDYYNDTDITSSPLMVQHCIASLRQSLMCSADISTIVWQWSDRYKSAVERANVIHSCRDFSKISAWVKDHYLDVAILDFSKHIIEDADNR